MNEAATKRSSGAYLLGANRWHEIANRHAAGNSLISVRAGVSAGQSKYARTPPEAATGCSSALRADTSALR